MSEIKLDIDCKTPPIGAISEIMRASRDILGINLRCKGVYETIKGFHIYLSSEKPLNPYEVLFFQALLGSDPVRELYNLQRIKEGKRDWNTLFRSKWDKGKCISEELHRPRFTRILQQGGFDGGN